MNLAYLAMLGRRYGRRPLVLQALVRPALSRPTAALLECVGPLSLPDPAPIDDEPAEPAAPIDDEDPAFEELAEIAAELYRTAAGASAETPAALERAQLAEGKVLCRCGGRGHGDRGFVPAWFGRECIEAGCELRAAAREEEAA